LLVIFIAIGIYAFFFEPYNPEITHVVIKNPELKRILADKVVVQLSDLHIKKLGKYEKKVLDIVNSLEPDLIFLTGDYISWKGKCEGAFEFFSQLKAGSGIWAVMGDYDYSNSRNSCLFCHKPGSIEYSPRNKIRFLKNTCEMITLPDGLLTVGGIDRVGEPYIKIDNLDFFEREDIPVVVLSHDPLNFEELSKDKKFLMLSGDTHGGQLAIPSWFWSFIGYKKTAKYEKGLYENKNGRMYVNKGIGTSHIPIRLFRPPEITVLHFQ
jgi:predicted MPP superfamily phosphohydrolase